MDTNFGAIDENENVVLEKQCFYCDGKEEKLVKSSIETTAKLNSWAVDLQDDNVLKNISNLVNSGGLSYHKVCFIKFSRKHDMMPIRKAKIRTITTKLLLLTVLMKWLHIYNQQNLITFLNQCCLN